MSPDTDGMPAEQGPIADRPEPARAAGPEDAPEAGAEARPRAAPRMQPRLVDRATGEAPEDWTSFDVTQSLRMLRTGTDAQIREELRKLHLRWWHATRTQMEKVLKAAGCPMSVTEKVASIVDTCRECRAWASHAPAPTPSVEMVTSPDTEVEGDIMFYKHYKVWHMIDRADRWHAAMLLVGDENNLQYRSSASLCSAIMSCWISIFGPFKYLVVDGEKGILGMEAKPFFDRHGITVRTRAPDQHARMIERRGAILRHAMHCAEEQLMREGLTVQMSDLLAECVCAGNSMVSWNGATPYNARFGRQPRMLPDMLAMPDDSAGIGRNMHRLREVALQRIIEATAIARINRAMKTAVRPSAQALDYQPDELVEFWRQQSTKDVSCWMGPAKVIKALPQQGQVKLLWRGGEILCKLGDVRRFMDFGGLCYGVVQDPGSPHCNAWGMLEQHISSLSTNTIERFGHVRNKDGIDAPTERSSTKQQVLRAIEFIARNVLVLDAVAAVHIGRGIKHFTLEAGRDASLVVWWVRGDTRLGTHWQYRPGRIHMMDLLGGDWQHLYYMHFVFDENVQLEDAVQDELPMVDERGSSAAADQSSRHEASSHNDRLSTIPEGSHEDGDADIDMVWWASLTEQQQTVMSEVLSSSAVDVRKDVDEEQPLPRQPPRREAPETPAAIPDYHYSAAEAEPLSTQDAIDIDEDGNAYVEMLAPDECHKLIYDQPVPPGYCCRLRVYVAGQKKAVIERDTDLLTPEEFTKHAKEVSAAVLEEFKVWIDHMCFKRRLRRGARNILDCRWVGKWKWTKSKTDPTKKVRIIRMRLTLRGFKDIDADLITTYAGTSSRLSQRVIVSEAACRGWTITAMDVKKAFLKGVTYKELSEATDEDEREVNFELSPDAVQILKQCPGYEDFDPTLEVLHMVKPGTGCKDAPRCWSIQLTRITNGRFKAVGTLYDDEFIARHNKGGELELLATKHVDDLKVTGTPAAKAEFTRALEEAFGKGEIDISEGTFTCCGVRHAPTASGGYEMDQTEYISALKTIGGSELVGRPNSELASATLSKLFLSLLMALAFTLLTRIDLHVYIVALQRHTSAPTYAHIRKLNTLVRWAQKNVLRLRYEPMTCAKVLEVHSDAAFRKEQKEGVDAGRALRGATFLRLGQAAGGCKPYATTQAGTVKCHLLDWQCGSLKTVTRSTFTSELMSAISSTDHALALGLTLHEVTCGPKGPREARALRDGTQQLVFAVDLCLDSMGVVTAVTAPRPKPPAEHSLLPHVLWLRDLLCLGQLRSLAWEDTRDMSADGLTKGSIKRSALHAVASGSRQRVHEPYVVSMTQAGATTILCGKDRQPKGKDEEE